MNSVEMNELNEMREQLATLKKQLDTQEIINDRLIKEVMTRKITSLNRSSLWVSIMCFISIPVCFATFFNLGMSKIFCFGTSSIFVFGLVGQFLAHHRLRVHDVMNGDLVSTYKAVSRLRKIYKRWHYVSIPIVAVWFLWMMYEIYTNVVNEDLTAMLAMSFSSALGGVIGGIIGLRIHKKALRTADDLLQQIEELQQKD